MIKTLTVDISKSFNKQCLKRKKEPRKSLSWRCNLRGKELTSNSKYKTYKSMLSTERLMNKNFNNLGKVWSLKNQKDWENVLTKKEREFRRLIKWNKVIIVLFRHEEKDSWNENKLTFPQKGAIINHI